MEQSGLKGTVCVTGAGGFVASWLVKLLLSSGYEVHGTVRNPDDEKNAHLLKLEKASERLRLFKADLLDFDSLFPAIIGCEGVFHTACPVPSQKVSNPEPEMVAPAVTGTLNVLKACSEAKIQKVIVVSSVVALSMAPSWPSGEILNEDCWSDKEYCKKMENWYYYSKTISEEAALKYGKETGLNVITVLPAMVLGRLLQPTVNASSLFLLNLLKGVCESINNQVVDLVDVRDVAEALVLTYESNEASGRYICASHTMMVRDLVEKLKHMYPEYKYPKNFPNASLRPPLTWEKLEALGWMQRDLDETLAEAIKYFQETGFLDNK